MRHIAVAVGERDVGRIVVEKDPAFEKAFGIRLFVGAGDRASVLGNFKPDKGVVVARHGKAVATVGGEHDVGAKTPHALGTGHDDTGLEIDDIKHAAVRRAVIKIEIGTHDIGVTAVGMNGHARGIFHGRQVCRVPHEIGGTPGQHCAHDR